MCDSYIVAQVAAGSRLQVSERTENGHRTDSMAWAIWHGIYCGRLVADKSIGGGLSGTNSLVLGKRSARQEPSAEGHSLSFCRLHITAHDDGFVPCPQKLFHPPRPSHNTLSQSAVPSRSFSVPITMSSESWLRLYLAPFNEILLTH